MDTVKEAVEEKTELKCEYLAISPRGDKHCVHDDHINWRLGGGCNKSMCPITKSILNIKR